MWGQGLLCYQKLCRQQGYKRQWPLMVPYVRRNRMSHRWHCDTKVQQPNTHKSVKWSYCRLCKQWKKRRGFWRRSHWKKKTKCWHTTHRPWFWRCCWACQCCRGYYSRRKRFLRRQRLLAFMCAAIKGRLRPMNLCGWRAPGMRAPRNTTQYIIHQVYEDMRQDEKIAAAAAANRGDKQKSELQLSLGYNDCDIVAACTSCMATVSATIPERDISTADEVREGESSRRSQTVEPVDPESHLSISCEP